MSGGVWKITALALAVLCLAAFGYLYCPNGWTGAHWPLANRAAPLADEAERLRSEVALLRGRVAELPDARERLERAAARARAAERLLAKGEEPGELAASIRARAEEAEVVPRWIQIRSVPASEGEEAAALPAWRFSVFAEGTYDQLAGFINRLEQIDQAAHTGSAGSAGVDAGETPFFEIRDLNITGGDNRLPSRTGADEDARHRCTLAVYTYRPDGEWLDNE